MKFKIIANKDNELNESNNNENKNYFSQKFNKYQINNSIEQKDKDKNNLFNRDQINNEILKFANKYLNNQNIDNINNSNDLLLKNESIEIKNNNFENNNKISIDKSKNINE